MKIAITSAGPGLDQPVDPRFGRASGFVVYDDATETHSFKDNSQNLSLAQGAGLQSAMNLAETGAKVIITGHVGPKAFAALRKGGIAICLAQGMTVRQALEAYKQGKLAPVSGPDKDGHW